ncbi:hypothetical protein DM01DRAFT_1302231 [Hesseltinella vesiculosa]|uniref:DNA repair REX1-B-domain-containing protein n=1 Tax=Hesseltinella vesiculosa TaxID=101127 RepID=A0A1X2GP48_9FUNG|nr:hypothetical protein DM01DRAFT_1302231 [Hesseltinella vesiculosa]
MSNPVLKKLQQLQRAQETRIALYQEFEEAYQDYLKEKCPEEQYSSICKIVTEGFQEVSWEIQAIESDFRDTDRADLAQLVRRLQLAEKEKLNDASTVRIQIYTIESKKGDMDYDATVEEAKQKLQHTMAEIQEAWDDIRQEMAEQAYEE